ncbi:MAG: ABC transporter substrate-binding protein [Bradyrhizobium sp.]
MRRSGASVHRRRRRNRAAVSGIQLNTADFSPYLGQLADLKVDAIFAMETGADATRLIQQYSSFGLKAKTPLLPR